MKRIKVAITQEHIKEGIPNHGDFCPVAMAFNAAGLSPVFVTSTAIIWPCGCVVSLPIRVRRFIRQFDRGHMVPKPLKFWVVVE